MYTSLRKLYKFCALSVLCVHIQSFRVKRIVQMNTSFARKETYAYVYGLCAQIGL